MKKKSRERFHEIVKVFAKYGIGILLESNKKENMKSPQNLRKALEELGPTFVKIGQILSTRSDLLPDKYVKELIKLQDAAPIEMTETIRGVFKESIGRDISECFKEFDDYPLASASIAQVHQAVLNDGTEVVVKIQRPDIYEIMKMDIAILKRLIKFTKIKITIVDPIAVLDEIAKITEEELNFITEGNNILQFIENNKKANVICAPKLITDIWSDKVIVMQKMDGIKISELDKIEAEGYDKKEIAQKLALAYCKQVFEDGFFHADPHPGNILIYENKICFLDFGIVGRLDSSLRQWLNSAMIAVATKDKEKLVEAILAIAIKKGRVDKGALYEDIAYIVDVYMTTSLKNIKIAVFLQEIFDVVKKNNMQFPTELSMLIRGLVILEGVVAEVDPEFEMITAVISFADTKNKRNILKIFDKEEIAINLYKYTRDGMRIPGKVLDVLNKIENGNTRIKLSVDNMDKYIAKFDTMVNRITGGLIISALVLSSSIIVSSRIGPCYEDISLIGIVGYFISSICAFVLLKNIVKTGKFSKEDKEKK